MRKIDLKRKKFIVLIVCAMMLFCSCSTAGNVHAPGKENGDITEEYVSEIDMYETPDGVFRTENSYVMLDGGFSAHIVYPVTDNEDVDREILSYIQNTVSKYNREAGENSAELNMEYEAYIVDKHFIGVKMTGIFEGPFMAHPEDIVKTFNGKTDGGTVKIRDIIKEETLEELKKMTADATGTEPELIDEELIENWNLTGRGLEITLERGKYGPMSDGTRSVLFTYAELGQKLAVDINRKTTVNDKISEEIAFPAEEVTVPKTHKIDPDKPMVALTFDDGPGAYTDRLLDILQKYEVQATFFLLGNKIDKRPETVQRMVEEGHEIGGHSWSHKELTKLTEKEIRTQIIKTNDKINEFTGLTPAVMRPPYGSYNDNVRAVARNLGISAINWNVDTLDWKYKDPEYVYEATMKGLKDGNIILFHDIHPTTVDAVEIIVPALLEEGYQLVTVSQLLTSGDREMIPGGLYFKR